MAEWNYPETTPAEAFCRIETFGIKQPGPTGEVEFVITVREYAHSPVPGMRFFAQADKPTNEKVAPFYASGWGQTLSTALWECLRELRRFPVQGD